VRNGERSGVSEKLRGEADAARDRTRSRIGFLFYASLVCKVLALPKAQCSVLRIRYSELPMFPCGDGLKTRRVSVVSVMIAPACYEISKALKFSRLCLRELTNSSVLTTL
jgi:hypothetical protein